MAKNDAAVCVVRLIFGLTVCEVVCRKDSSHYSLKTAKIITTLPDVNERIVRWTEFLLNINGKAQYKCNIENTYSMSSQV